MDRQVDCSLRNRMHVDGLAARGRIRAIGLDLESEEKA